MDRRCLGAAAAVLALAVALGVFFLPLFTSGVSALTGDNLTHSLPLNLDLARSLHGAPFRFWDSRAAFGFPVYAEGTSGWCHPWKLLVLALFPNLTGHDLLYVSSFFLTGAGGFFVSRALGLGVAAAFTGALAIAFSPVVLDNAYNVSYAHSTAWAAVCLLAFEHWWAVPSRRRCALLAASTALAMTAGYPPTAYALFLFLGVVVATRLALDRTQLAARVAGFAGALALGMGLAALMVLPLLELAGQSVRQDSVAVLNAFPWPNFAVGLVFDPDPVLYAPGRYAFFTAPLGSVLAALAVPFLPALRDRRAQSYLAGIVVCAGAASGQGSAIFEVLRATLPGFDRLRLLSPFLFVAVVPAGVLLAALLEAATRGERAGGRRIAIAAVAIVFALLLAASIPARTALAWYRGLDLGLLAVSVLGLVTLRRVGRPAAVWWIWIAVLAIEITALRSGHRAWLPDAVLDEGRGLAAALGERSRAEPDARAIHFPSQLHRATFDGMVKQHWKSPGYAGFVRTGRRVEMPLANLLDDLPFAGTSGALALAGYAELMAQMHDELRGRSTAPPGERAIDRWQVRWMVLHGDLAKLPRAAGFERVWSDPRGDVELLENASALARYQWQAHAGETGAALEAPPAWRRAIEALPWVTAHAEAPFAWDTPEAGRLFAAIPLHPSWTAVLDDRPVRPLRAADGFGMEVPAAAGAHRIEFRFVPHAFHAGVLVSVASLLVFAALLRGRAAS